MRVEVFQVQDTSVMWFRGWYRVRHIKTQLPFPMVFQFKKDADAAAVHIDQIANWDGYAETVTDDERNDIASYIDMQMFTIADAHNGVRLDGEPLNHQKLALMKRAPEEVET